MREPTQPAASRRWQLLAMLVLAVCGGAPVRAQAQASPACGVAPVVNAHAQPNVFSDEQEGWLGEAMAESLEPYIRPVRDPALSQHLQQIADRLVATLPPSAIRYRVLLIESSEVNGLSIAGGHIYITRKLAAAAHSDDELAGVIGHEIGHIASHQYAFEQTRELKRLLQVTSVGDRADVFAKYHALMDAQLRDKHPEPVDSDTAQDEADHIGVYAEAAAGYRPTATPEFWDRVFFVGGRTRGKLADFFNITKPTEKRLRLLRAMASALPPGCGGSRSGEEQAFAAWHSAVVADQKGIGEVQGEALSMVALTPPLRAELRQLRFSPDGRSVLAQDEGSIFVLSRAPFAVRYRIDAENAQPAHFSPDSQSLSFSTPGLHTEQWSTQTHKLLAAHELLWRDPCYESRLAPDGRSLLCVGMNPDDLELSLTLLDPETSQPLWQRKNWAPANWSLALRYVVAQSLGRGGEVLPSALSADNNLLLIGAGADKAGFDLRTRTPLRLGSGLNYSTSGSYAFLGSDKVAMVDTFDPKQSALLSFPEGKHLRTLQIPPKPLLGLSNTGADLRVVMFGSKEFDAGLADLGSGQMVRAAKSHALDQYGETLVAEADSGIIGLIPANGGPASAPETVTLPLSPLSRLQAVALSPDGRYLAASTRFRGGLWELSSGRQLAVLYGFSDATWTEDNTVYLETVEQFGSDRHMAQISTKTQSGRVLPYKVEDDMHMRFGRLLTWKEDAKRKTWELSLLDPADSKVLWSREFHDPHLGYTASYGDRDLLFSFALKSDTAREALKADPQLASEAAALHNKDHARLLRVLNARTGEVDGSMVLELPDNYAGVGGVNRAGDLLYVTTQDERTAVYSIRSGEQQRKIFGVVMAMHAETGRVCTANRIGEAIVYDASGSELAHLRLGEPIRFAAFRQGGKVLTVLTADQIVRTFAVDAAAPPRAVAAVTAAAPAPAVR